MKKLIGLALILSSLNAFSQSYMILNNGVTLTVDSKGFIYDFNNFTLPYKVKLAGGTFFLDEDKIFTVDENGYLYKKDFEQPGKILGKGRNYFVNELYDRKELVTVDQQGYVYNLEDSEMILDKVSNYGGNYFVTKVNERKKLKDLYTVTSKGTFGKQTVAGLSPFDITTFGGNWFRTSQGINYTVNKDGFVFSKEMVTTSNAKVIGGNFFIDETNVLYTIAEDGTLFKALVPASFKAENIFKVGYNYLITSEGQIFTVDALGNVNERFLKDHDLRNVKIFTIKK